MTIIKLLSAGLIAVAMLATPVMARESSRADRHAAEGAKEVAAHSVEGRAPAPHVGAFAAMPRQGEGNACDIGDNAHVC